MKIKEIKMLFKKLTASPILLLMCVFVLFHYQCIFGRDKQFTIQSYTVDITPSTPSTF